MSAGALLATLNEQERQELHRSIVGDYKGSYSLGVRGDCLLLRVAWETKQFPHFVTINGRRVPVIVEVGFVARSE